MCQQTQIKTVLPYYDRWIKAFPDFKSLANASVDEVMRLWSGLGYYSRGRKLLEAAKYVEERGVPVDVEGWKMVPGVGDYTAGAVSSIAFGVPTGAVDGNVCRVFSRLFLISADLTKGKGKQLIWTLANEMVDRDIPGDFNQSVMELGAMICTPVNPDCENCPVAGECRAYEEAELVDQGKLVEYDVEDLGEMCGLCPPFKIERMDTKKWISSHYPRKAVKKAPAEQNYITAVISRKSENGLQYLLVQRPETGLLAGLWDFPNIPLEETDPEDSDIVQSLLVSHLATLGLTNLGKLYKKGSSLHIFTHIRRTSFVYYVEVAEDVDDEVEGTWATEEEIGRMAVSELGRKVLRLALGVDEKKRKKATEKVVNRKVVKLEKGQTKLVFAVTQRKVSTTTEVEE